MKKDTTTLCLHGGRSEQPERKLPYAVGALLYAPATNDKIVRSILQQKIRGHYSAALCLEDSISDASVTDAEEKIISSFRTIQNALSRNADIYIPKLFIRVRKPEQIPDLFRRLKSSVKLLTGFIAPKYSPQCAESYNRQILAINEQSSQRVYLMPTLETWDIISPATRDASLQLLREKADQISHLILNIRIGGNDFCNAFGVRREADQTIYDILPVSRVLSDILAVFSPDYVVSGPVWEYFSGEERGWKQGLERELRLDRLNGMVGKTVIHPDQIPVVNDALRVSAKDLEDAKSILSWSPSKMDMVEKSPCGERMNEVKVHTRWAEKILKLADIYGIKPVSSEFFQTQKPEMVIKR